MSIAERIAYVIVIGCAVFLIWNMATDEGQHPLDNCYDEYSTECIEAYNP